MYTGHKFPLEWKTFFFLRGSMGWMRESRLRVTRNRSSSCSSWSRTVISRGCRSLTRTPTSCEKHTWEEQPLGWTLGCQGLCRKVQLCFLLSYGWNLVFYTLYFTYRWKNGWLLLQAHVQFAGKWEEPGQNTTNNPDFYSSPVWHAAINLMVLIFSAL